VRLTGFLLLVDPLTDWSDLFWLSTPEFAKLTKLENCFACLPKDCCHSKKWWSLDQPPSIFKWGVIWFEISFARYL